ncbi:MAG: hypothetical protein ACI88C_001339 [Acidimicrobiales bacterium]|jgi:hypothetical protein
MGPVAGTGANITAMSYDGGFEIGMFIDPEAITDPDAFRDHVEAAFADMFAELVPKKPTAKKAVAKKPAPKKPTAKKAVANKPAPKKPTAKKAVANKPAPKKPTAKKAVANKTAAKPTS